MSEISSYLSVGIAVVGYLYITIKSSQWLVSACLKEWSKRRKKERQLAALTEFHDAFRMQTLESGESLTVKNNGLKITISRE